MDIVYKLTNIDKEKGRRFYVGCKQECHIKKDTSGIPTIFSQRGNTPYYGSSQSPEMKEELKRGDRFSAEILQKVKEDENMYEVESGWIEKLDCISSDEYYNISNHLRRDTDQDAVLNKYGETYKEVASNNGTVSRKDNIAKNCGFSNYGEFMKHILVSIEEGRTHRELSIELGFQPKYVRRYIKGLTLPIFNDMVDSLCRNDMINMLKDGATLKKISSYYNVHDSAARYLIGDFTIKGCIATDLNLSVIEAEDLVGSLVIDERDFTFSDIADQLGISKSSVSRYFISYAKRRLRSSDS